MINMDSVLEVVPNFSEGQNLETIKAIENAFLSVDKVKVLHIDIGFAANRTVFTVVGSPDNLFEASFRAVKTAVDLIDMRFQKGEHPRLGAVDVFPFIPIANFSMEQTVELARNFAKRIGTELNFPIYCYEDAAFFPERKRLENIRKGEYENLITKLGQPEWKPDFGEPNFVAKTGASIIGARNFLVAYNLNLDTKDVEKAKKIAGIIRESGTKWKNENGLVQQKNGLLPSVKAIGWYIKEYDCAQVSTNVTNYDTTPLWKVFETTCLVAQDCGAKVTGSELIGMIPERYLVETGMYVAQRRNYLGLSKLDLVRLAIDFLSLNDLKPFLPEERIIEWAMVK